jgi:hypothetical protein
VLTPSRIRIWQWGLDIRIMIFSALDILKWMQKIGLLKNGNKNGQNKDNYRVSSDGNEVSNNDDHDNNNSNNKKNHENLTDNEEIEHVNYHSKWLNNVRRSCLLTSRAIVMNKGQEGDQISPDEEMRTQSQQEEEGDWSETLEGAFAYTFMYYLCVSSY